MCAKVGGVLLSQALMSDAIDCRVWGTALTPINKLHALSYRPPTEMAKIRPIEMGFKWSCGTLAGRPQKRIGGSHRRL